MMHHPISQVSLSSTSSVLSAEKSAQQLQQEKAERDERYAVLTARKEALEKKIREKNDELKRLCVQEAELTGQLPLETPLEPGETPPHFRRRVGTAFTIPEVLIDKLTSDEEQTLAALELEYKILSQITCAAMRMASDVSLKRSLRRQRRLEYQQHSKRLTDLEMRLNEARKNHKHRKKPRPISDTVGMEGSAADKEPNEGGFGGTNLTKSVRSYSASDRPPSSSSSSLSHQQHHHHHHNHLHDSTKQHHYLKSDSPDFRSHRQHLQRLSSGGYISSHHQHAICQRKSPTNHYQTLTGTPSELDQLSRHDTAFLVSHNNFSPFMPLDSSYKYLHSHTARPAASQNFLDENDPLDVSPVRRPSLESRSSSSRWKSNRCGSLDRKKKMAKSSPNLDTDSLEVMLPEDVVDRPNLVMTSTRPKTLKRAVTKQLQAHAHHSHLPPPVHQRQKSVKETWTPPPQPRLKERTPPAAEALLPGQTYPETGYGHVAVERARAASGSLTRTQSLGAVSSASSSRSADSRSIRDMYPATSYTQQQQQQQLPPPKRHQQPPPPPPPPERPPSRRPLEAAKESTGLSGSFSSLHLSHETAAASPMGSVCSCGSSELRKGVEGQEAFETVVPFESPKNHMVIQAGMWQPYREESKPFEMSDFYKYSTKFRKAKPANDKQQPLHLRLEEEATVSLPKMLPSPTPSMSPQHKGVYQPLQPMTCQPVGPNKALSPELPAKQSKVMSPNLSLNMSNGESLADAFSTEMLAWYQDKSSVPRSATLV
ncbi:cyclin-dependent kinase 12 isoform X2 [Cloeon dipterum]|uniref:cyclin-dependent kinase 12 isoform X2 n=1 Tax=Cloeon dipterum TaxID=197152 RepID=UPI00321FB6A9